MAKKLTDRQNTRNLLRSFLTPHDQYDQQITRDLIRFLLTTHDPHDDHDTQRVIDAFEKARPALTLGNMQDITIRATNEAIDKMIKITRKAGWQLEGEKMYEEKNLPPMQQV